MQRWSLAACGEASIAESALRMSQQVRAALGEPSEGYRLRGADSAVSRLMISRMNICDNSRGVEDNRLKQVIMVAGYKEMLCVRLIHTCCE